MASLTLAVCAHNASRRLPATLEYICAQKVKPGTKWEVLVIDNASSDDTATVAQSFADRCPAPLRVIGEPKPGLANARRAAARAAECEFVSFVDDDNLISPEWVDTALAFLESHPTTGVLGGRIVPHFEDPASVPPDFDERFARRLACFDFGDRPFRYLPPVHYPPCGAGMTMPTALLRKILLEIGTHLSGRTGGRLISGEDYEIGILATRLGYEAWHLPQLSMLHVIPPSRLTKAYLAKLVRGNVESNRWLEYLRGNEPQRSRLWYLARAGRSMLTHFRMRIIARIRGSNHPDSGRFAGWIEEQYLRAAGDLSLFRSYPFKRVEPFLRTAPPAPPPSLDNVIPANFTLPFKVEEL